MPDFHEIVFTKHAERDFEKLPQDIRERIDKKLFSLAKDPLQPDTEKVDDDTFRARVGNYRIIFRLENNNVVILVIRIRHRKDVYRKVVRFKTAGKK